MGVYGVNSFICRQVRSSCVPVNIGNGIRNYDGTPTIVIYTPSLLEPLNEPDISGVLCGGRYEMVFQTMNRFLKELVQLGARLVGGFIGRFDEGKFV